MRWDELVHIGTHVRGRVRQLGVKNDLHTNDTMLGESIVALMCGEW